MTNICNYEEGCSLPSSSNELEILLQQIKRDVKNLLETNEAKLLEQDGKIAETCVYIKNNLSNEIRVLLDSMQLSGELDDIITDTILGEIGLINSKIASVKDYGAIGDGCTDDTLCIQKAINDCLDKGIGQLLFPGGSYLVTSPIEITHSKRLLCFELKGQGMAQIKPSISRFKGDSVFKVTSNITDNDLNKMKRYLSIKDLIIGNHDDNGFVNTSGLYIEQMQFLNLDNVMIRGFKQKGLILRDVFDSIVHNVRVINCGDIRGENPSNEDYAVLLQGEIDNVNAVHFYGLQVERCPLMLKIQSRIRHCQFTDCKFEQTTANYTNLSPIFVDGRSGENIFTNCQFVKNTNGGNNTKQYFIETSEATSYNESAQFNLLINGCMFTCAPNGRNTGHWLNVDGSTITNNQFNHCAGNEEGLFAFRLLANNIFTNNKVFVTSWNTNTFRIMGGYNQIKDNVITYTAGSNVNAGVFLSMDVLHLGNVIEGNIIKNNPYQPYALPGTTLGNLIIRNNVGKEITKITQPVGEPVLLYGSDILVIEHSTPTPIYQIKYGYNGQKLSVYSKHGGHTINHNTSHIYLKEQAPYITKAGEVIEFVNIDGVWYQI